MLDLSTLNPPQREAVLHGDGPLVVFAGAGSGKTRVITYRIARMVQELQVPAYRILAVTFTNKAAAEMRQRIHTLLPQQEVGNVERALGPREPERSNYGRGPWIGTFHSICARLLRRHAEAVGLNPQFVIYDDTDQKSLMTRIVRELDLDDRRYAPRELMRFVERQKQQLLRPEQVSVEDAFEEVCARVYTMYEQRLQAASAVDFNDLLVRMVYALQTHQGVRDHLQKMWSYILVDEFQDTNLVQLELVRILAEKHQNLCVVGDDDQSIYKWRGADRRNILDFRQSFPNAAVIKLEQNYRSSGHILATAMAVIAKNLDREPKQLWTSNDPGPKVRLVTCYDERDEARAITEAVRALRDRYKLAEMAVFYRTHAQSRVLEEELRASKLNYRVVGGQRFYERSEVKDVLAYLRVLVNPADDVSLLRIINVPTRGIGKTTLDKVLELAAQGGQGVWNTLLAALAGAYPSELMPKSTIKKLEVFVNLVRDHMLRAQSGLGPATLAEQLMAEIGYLQALRDADTVEADGRIDNVQELIASMREFETEAEDPTVALYLELMALQTNADEIDDSEKLTLMTVHAAKGLEFPVVWVAGLEERLFPMSREAYISEDDLEEERRLAYVAFTRAEKRLFLSHARARRLHGEALVGLPSRFLKEIPKEHVEPVSRVNESQGYTASSVGTRYESSGQVRFGSGAPSGFRHPQERGKPQPKFTGVKTTPAKRPAGESYVDRSDGDDPNQILRGARVRHAKFGEGSVLQVEAGRPPKVTVKFDQVGIKTLVASFLEPA
jgi:DNA helicase II / ATP-dependent DNA helicase PcrA